MRLEANLIYTTPNYTEFGDFSQGLKSTKSKKIYAVVNLPCK